MIIKVDGGISEKILEKLINRNIHSEDTDIRIKKIGKNLSFFIYIIIIK